MAEEEQRRFKFKLLTGNNPRQQYDDISLKDDMTFYLSSTGFGYLGTIKLFDTDEDKLTIQQDLEQESNVNQTDVASTKAVVDYVNSVVNNLNIMTGSFFRKVQSHTLTDSDLTNSKINKPNGVKVGDVGLLFTADDDPDDDGDETYYFISLEDYLANTYTVSDTDSINISLDSSNNITANLKISTNENSILLDENGVYLNKTTGINDGDGTTEVPEPSPDKLVTESALVAYVQQQVLVAVELAIKEALKDVVTYTENNGINNTNTNVNTETSSQE